MRIKSLHALLYTILFPFILWAQSNFSRDAYYQFLQSNQNLDYPDLQSRFASKYPYYKGFQGTPDLDVYLYLDSIRIKMDLTEDELELLRQNQFMVTERLSRYSFTNAFLDIYHADLPVFISTDAILHTIHMGYDQMLYDIEILYLKPNLRQLLEKLYNGIPELITKYQAYPELQVSLSDIDLYTTIAFSLIDSVRYAPHIANQEALDLVWNAILSQNYMSLPLFTSTPRPLDFSQFIVRGHYDCEELRHYFKAMMWLGRTDFLLTPAPGLTLSAADLKRMNIDAYLMNELIDTTQSRDLLSKNDQIIRFFVGESDNLTPQELDEILTIQSLTSAIQLLDTTTYNSYQAFLQAYPNAGQRIFSDIFLMDPFATEPAPLPISYRLMGQRFIIDSYIFANVVYDRIIYQNRKIWRPLPDPLDAMFVLGNDNALPLLAAQLDSFHYASQLNALRYLVDSYDDSFWRLSLYNYWLNAIRSLNPPIDRKGMPLFLQSTAWQQAKLNTQLASWAQLRHDNLLYAKQSYTGGIICSFPHSYVEPNPDFFVRLAGYASQAQELFAQHGISDYFIDTYLTNLKDIMTKLENLARKELNRETFTETEKSFLKSMLFPYKMCGGEPTGWYADLFYMPLDIENQDDPIADVHTQPTDVFGTPVGNVLHVGTGDVNMGVFLANSPSSNYQPMAYIGPVFSYYEKVTSNFDRLTDRRWQEMVNYRNLPERPDWTNIYLANKAGKQRSAGREIPSQIYQSGLHASTTDQVPTRFALYQNYPNPFNISTIVKYDLPEQSQVTLAIFNVYGQLVTTLVNATQPAGTYTIRWNGANLSSGLYFYRLQTDKFQQISKASIIK